MSDPHVDYVIVGGGSAGSALANRLSADASTRVLVLEASRPDSAWDPFIHVPALPRPIGNRRSDRKLESEPERYLNDRCIDHGRGGSSSTSAMVFQRGNPLDYERWAAGKGMASWDYAHCLPYFKRIETCVAGADQWRGGCGPLLLERGPALDPVSGAFFEAVQQAGYPLTEDVNGYRQEGFATFDRTDHRDRGHSAARAYLHPALHRGNLRVETGARATRVLFSGRRAVGAEYRRRGRTWRVRAREVVLAGGAFGSPQLLQLSGVGNAAELESLGIDVVADLPGVGEHLQDHLEVHVRHGSRPQVPVSGRRRPRIGAGWRSARKGLVATSQLDAGGFMRGNDDVAYPNLMLHFQPLVLGYDGSAPTGGHGYQVHVGPVCSDARGTVKIRSRDPAAHPVLRFGYLSSRRDRSDWVEAVRVARRILSRPALAPYDCEELSPGPAVRTDEEILDWVRNDAETALHPSSTARMGTDEMSVLDPGSLRVHGVEGLRVVDASAMPYVTNGGTCAPVMMLAEKAADLILGNTPLPPCAVGYYRHGEDMPLHPRRHEPQRHEPQHHEPQHHGPQAHEPATTGRNP